MTSQSKAKFVLITTVGGWASFALVNGIQAAPTMAPAAQPAPVTSLELPQEPDRR